MNINIYSEDTKLVQRLKGCFENVLEKILTTTGKSLTELHVYLIPTKENLIKETQTTGEVLSTNSLVIKFNPDELDFNEVESSFIHEITHLLREQKYEYGKTLSESIVTEGLSVWSEIKFGPFQTRPYVFEVNDKLWGRFKTEVMSNDDFSKSNQWLFGSDTIFKWTGYAIGYDKVKDFINKHNFKTALEASAKDILFYETD